MYERRSRRRFIIPLILLIAALGLGVVYAATTGVLNFSGTSVISPNTLVSFEDYYIDPTNAQDSISVDGNTISFTVYLANAGAEKSVWMRFINDSNVPVLLGSLTPSTSPPSGISVTWPTEFNNQRLDPGEYTEYDRVLVKWTGPMTLEPGSHSFTATLSYAQTT